MNDTIKERPLPGVPVEDQGNAYYLSNKISQSELDNFFKSNLDTVQEERQEMKREFELIKLKLDQIDAKIDKKEDSSRDAEILQLKETIKLLEIDKQILIGIVKKLSEVSKENCEIIKQEFYQSGKKNN